MTPSPSPAPSVSVSVSVTQTQTQVQVQPQPQPQPNPNLRRAKKETTLFHKRPSRPFALAAMQAANGTAARSAAGSGAGVGVPAGGARANQSGMASRASPIPKPQNAGPSPSPSSAPSTPNNRASPSGASTPSTSQGTAEAAAASTTTGESAPAVGFTDFRIVSTDRHGWKFDVMKFDSRRPVDVTGWAQPIKLNRKEIKRPDANGVEAGDTPPTPIGPMLGPDGKPVIGADGRIVMVDAEGRAIHDAKPAGSATAAKGGKDDKGKKRKFQKKTRQVFLVPDHVRQLRKEERYPWVMEDASGAETWEGRMEEASKAELHALFMPSAGSAFCFVPAHRWYKFQKRRPQQQTWSLEEAEKMMAKMQKNKDQERWLMRSRNGNAAPTAGGLGGPSLVYDAGGSSLGPGGRRLRTVDTGMRGLFDEDDEEGTQEMRRRERERGGEGDMDEMEYEEDFADDEEKMEPEGVEADEEAKELEERLKREYRNANKTREGYIDESDEEEDADNLTGAGKDMKKLVRKIEKNEAYDSDDDKNPYASSEEDEEEEIPQPTPSGPAVQDQSASRPGSTSQSKANSRPASKAPSRGGSRPGSPAPPGSGGSSNVKVKSEGVPSMPPPASPVLGMGGHSIVAKRATSPKAPKMKGQAGGNRATSPLAGAAGSRAGSPNPVSPGASRATSPVPAGSPSKKRKAEGEVAGGQSAAGGAGAGRTQPKPKKRKPTTGAIGSAPSTPAPMKSEPGSDKKPPLAPAPSSAATVEPGMELTAALLVSWMQASPDATTRECIHYFQPCLTDDAKKARFTALVKEVASLKGGVLALKPQYRDGAVEEGRVV